MFAETLIESSAAARKRKRWPMATAFTAQTIIAAVLIIVPLLSTGVIPLSARMQIVAPLKETPLERVKPVRTDSASHSGPAGTSRQVEVVLVSDNPNKILFGHEKGTTKDQNEAKPGDPNIGRRDGIPDLGDDGNGSNVTLVPTRVPISKLSEAQLVNRVEPVYPRIAVVTGVQGQVKLHAIIARDGKIISLNAISGHPLLVRAAMDAVSQWRYRPYYLNGEAVEVETFITVNFKREGR
jgi:protein TonB